MSYSVIAPLYDRINGDQYEPYAAFLRQVFSRFGSIPVKEVLDLGCGTGSIAALLADDFDMVGLDASTEMLSIAMEKNAGKNTLLLCQDMREFELYGTVQGVYSSFDCLNYLKPEDLGKVFSLVHNYLEPGGVFVFDVNTPYRFKTTYADRDYILEDEGTMCCWRNRLNKKGDVVDFYLTVFEERDGVWHRTDGVERERAYGLRAIENALNSVGLELCDVSAGYGFEKPGKTTERWYITAKKPL